MPTARTRRETWSFGSRPYPQLEDAELRSFLEAGHRLKQPELCTDKVYALMAQCWDPDPAARPAPAGLVQRLKLLAEDSAAPMPLLSG